MKHSVDTVNQSGTPAPDVFERMHDLMHRMRHYLARHAVHGGEVSPLEGKALGFFSRHPGATLSDLVAHSGRDKGQLAKLVAGLRERGLLEAQVDPQDRRVTRLHPSASARALHAQVQRERRALASRACATLDATELAQLQGLLQRLQQHLDTLE